jgi:asparagine synthetase B (glutamine-hydrolysing)
VETFIEELEASVRRRVENIPLRGDGWVSQLGDNGEKLIGSDPRVAVLFSGGIDCTFLAYLVHRYVPLSLYTASSRRLRP